ncbi:hypothetical protein ES708_29977 [subsurface metagenome]
MLSLTSEIADSVLLSGIHPSIKVTYLASLAFSKTESLSFSADNASLKRASLFKSSLALLWSSSRSLVNSSSRLRILLLVISRKSLRVKSSSGICRILPPVSVTRDSMVFWSLTLATAWKTILPSTAATTFSNR